MALPRKLKNFNLFVDGISFAGIVNEVTLPVLSRKMEEFRAAGMNGPVEVDLGTELLTLEWKCGGFVREVFAQYANTRVDGVLLRFAGALQRDDTGEVTAVEVTVRGRHKEINPGTSTAGEDTELSITSTLSYYKLTMDGETVIEIDIPNMVEMVNGEDRLAQQRTAIGL